MKQLKQLLFLILSLFMACGVSACHKLYTWDKKQEEPNSIVTQTPCMTQVPEQIDSDQALILLSEELTKNYIQRKTDGIIKILDDKLENMLTNDTLLQAYDSVSKSLGQYVKIDSSKIIQQEKLETVLVTVEYENKGLVFSYTYNEEGKLSGLHMNYKSIVKTVTTDLFTEKKIQIGEEPYVLDGIITIPNGVENPPVIILVQGSGPSDLNETVGKSKNQPFKDLAWGLAEHKIATIRFNKRTNQYQGQLPANITIKEEVLEDVSYAISYAKSCGMVNSNQIYIAGHSLGGMLAPQIAYDNEAVRGIVVLAGSPRKLEDIIYDQNVMLLQQTEQMTEAQKKSQLEQIKNVVEQIKNIDQNTMTQLFLGVPGSYWDSLNQIDVKEVVQKLTIPMLFLQGDKDFQVYVDKDYQLWKQLLEHNPQARFIEYQNLNHLFMPTNNINGIEDYDPENHVSEQVIKDISNWVHEKLDS